MIRHKVINGICYQYKVTEESLGRCEEHNPPKKAADKERKKE